MPEMEGHRPDSQQRISSHSGVTVPTSVEGRASTDSKSTGGLSVQHTSASTSMHFQRPPSAPWLNTTSISDLASPVSPLLGTDTVTSTPPASHVDDRPAAPRAEQPQNTARESSRAASGQTRRDDVQHTPLAPTPLGACEGKEDSPHRTAARAILVDERRTSGSVNEKRKPGFIASVRQLSRSSSWGRELGLSPPQDIPEWQPTFVRLAPLLGIAALFLVVCCMLASLGILVGSSGEKVADWPWSPSVYLAISSAIIGRSLQFALLQAIPLAWWYKASYGSTIKELQRHWESGQGICRALYNIKAEPILAFAMLASTLVIADGPFLQKASSVKSELQTSPVVLQIPVAPEIPTGFGGKAASDGISTGDYIDSALKDFTYNSTLVANITGCGETCHATIHGPGVAITNCSSKTWPLTPDELELNSSSTWGSGISGGVAPMPLFNIQIRDKIHDVPPFSGTEEVELQIGIANFTACTGQYTETTCRLVSAVMEYEVEIHRSNQLRFVKPPSEAKVVALANNTFIDRSNETVRLTIIALGAFLQGQIAANATMEPVTDARQSGAAIMPNRNSFNNMVTKFTIESAYCNSSFADPTMSVLDQFNNLMFRAGIAAANYTGPAEMEANLDPGLHLIQEIHGEQTTRLAVFRSDLRWWAGAALLELLAVLAILPVFWGYWRLGLHVTMSPFEIANVFQAPLLQSVNSASGSSGVVHKMGNVTIQCGTAGVRSRDSSLRRSEEEADAAGRLLFEEPDRIMHPRKGTRFVE